MSYPFSALVGQEEMVQALLLHAVDPRLGGVLILGERGTGKSTAVRSLAALLPPMQAVEGCPFHCDPQRPDDACTQCRGRAEAGEELKAVSCPVPVVDLPLGTTEDRLLGGLDVEIALAEGRKAFAPGLLGRANRGFLYVDEVNLLEDHLVDLLLDAAASGVHTVERDGVSLRHPARFVLVGSANPEEGDVRPQLLDRFGLCVATHTLEDITDRMEVVRRRYRYEQDPAAFIAEWSEAQADLRLRIVEAQERLQAVSIPDETVEAVARAAVLLGVEGHRGEVAALRAAAAHAAFQGRRTAEPADLEAVAAMAFRHRLPGFSGAASADGNGSEALRQALAEALRR